MDCFLSCSDWCLFIARNWRIVDCRLAGSGEHSCVICCVLCRVLDKAKKVMDTVFLVVRDAEKDLGNYLTEVHEK